MKEEVVRPNRTSSTSSVAQSLNSSAPSGCELCDSAGRCTYACDYDRLAETAAAMGITDVPEPPPPTQKRGTQAPPNGLMHRPLQAARGHLIDAKDTTKAWRVTNEYDGYEAELAKFAAEFPGWWLTGGACSVSCHCTIGPDRDGSESELLGWHAFDSGFDADLEQPTTMALALRSAMDVARESRADLRGDGEGRVPSSNAGGDDASGTNQS